MSGQAMQEDVVLLCGIILDMLAQLPPPFVPDGAYGKIAVLVRKYEAGVSPFVDPPDITVDADPLVLQLNNKVTE